MNVNFLDNEYKILDTLSEGLMIEAFGNSLLIPYEVLNEAKSEAPLYRVLGPRGTISAIKDNEFRKDSSYGICFTRDKNYWIGDLDGVSKGTKLFQFRINQYKLASDYKIITIAERPYQRKDQRSESEERILATVKNVNRYLECIDTRKGYVERHLKSLKKAVTRYNDYHPDAKVTFPLKLTMKFVEDLDIVTSRDYLRAITTILDAKIPLGPNFYDALEKYEIVHECPKFVAPTVTSNFSELEAKVKEIQDKLPPQPNAEDTDKNSPVLDAFTNRITDIRKDLKNKYGYQVHKITDYNYQLLKIVGMPFNPQDPTPVELSILLTPSDLVANVKGLPKVRARELNKYLKKIVDSYLVKNDVIINIPIDILNNPVSIIMDLNNIEKILKEFTYEFVDVLIENGAKLNKYGYTIKWDQLIFRVDPVDFEMKVKIAKGNNGLEISEIKDKWHLIYNKYFHTRKGKELITNTIPVDMQEVVNDLSDFNYLLELYMKNISNGTDAYDNLTNYLQSKGFIASYDNIYTIDSNEFRVYFHVSRLTLDIKVSINKKDYSNWDKGGFLEDLSFTQDLMPTSNNYSIEYYIKNNNAEAQIEAFLRDFETIKEREDNQTSEIVAKIIEKYKMKNVKIDSKYVKAEGIVPDSDYPFNITYAIDTQKTRLIFHDDRIEANIDKLKIYAVTAFTSIGGNVKFIVDGIDNLDKIIELALSICSGEVDSDELDKDRAKIIKMCQAKDFLEVMQSEKTHTFAKLGANIGMNVEIYDKDMFVGIIFYTEVLKTHKDYATNVFSNIKDFDYKTINPHSKGINFTLDLDAKNFGHIIQAYDDFEKTFNMIPQANIFDASIKYLQSEGFSIDNEVGVLTYDKDFPLIELSFTFNDSENPKDSYITAFIIFKDFLLKNNTDKALVFNCFNVLTKSNDHDIYDNGIEINLKPTLGDVKNVLGVVKSFNDVFTSKFKEKQDDMRDAIIDLLNWADIEFKDMKSVFKFTQIGKYHVEGVFYAKGTRFIFRFDDNQEGVQDLFDDLCNLKHSEVDTSIKGSLYIIFDDIDVASEAIDIIKNFKPKKDDSIDFVKQALINGFDALGYHIENNLASKNYDNIVVDIDFTNYKQDSLEVYVSIIKDLEKHSLKAAVDVLFTNTNKYSDIRSKSKLSSGISLVVPKFIIFDLIDAFKKTDKAFNSAFNNEPVPEPTQDDEAIDVPIESKGINKYIVKKGQIATSIVPFAKGQVYEVIKTIKSIYSGQPDTFDKYEIEVLSIFKNGKVKCKNLTLGYEFKINTDPSEAHKVYILLKDVKATKAIKAVEPVQEPSSVVDDIQAQDDIKLKPNKRIDVQTKNRKGDLINKVYDLKFKKTGNPDFDDAIDRILNYIKKNQKVLVSRADLGIWLLDSPKELQRYKLDYPAVLLMFYDTDMSAIKQDPIFLKFYKSKALSIIRQPFKTKDLNGNICIGVAFYDAKTASKYKLKLIAESLESGQNITFNNIDFKVLALNEDIVELQSPLGIVIKTSIDQLYVELGDFEFIE